MAIASPTLTGMGAESIEESAALLALLRIKPNKATWNELVTAVLHHGSAIKAWPSLTDDGSLAPPTFGAELAAARVEVEDWRARGLTYSSVLDPRYPAQLRDIHQAPPFLFFRGTRRDDDVGVCIVGSRQATPLGLAAARSAAHALSTDGITVVSGLAAGIDTAAHQAALDAGGRTVAVMGTGIERVYPSSNTQLAADIARSEGLLISQFWPDATPSQQSFPMRNAVMSGYGVATFVAEASENSGSRIQARMAVEHGRPVILNESVVRTTTWGKGLVGAPGVYVVEGSSSFRSAVEQIRERNSSLLDSRVSFASVA